MQSSQNPFSGFNEKKRRQSRGACPFDVKQCSEYTVEKLSTLN